MELTKSNFKTRISLDQFLRQKCLCEQLDSALQLDHRQVQCYNSFSIFRESENYMQEEMIRETFVILLLNQDVAECLSENAIHDQIFHD